MLLYFIYKIQFHLFLHNPVMVSDSIFLQQSKIVIEH